MSANPTKKINGEALSSKLGKEANPDVTVPKKQTLPRKVNHHDGRLSVARLGARLAGCILMVHSFLSFIRAAVLFMVLMWLGSYLESKVHHDEEYSTDERIMEFGTSSNLILSPMREYYDVNARFFKTLVDQSESGGVILGVLFTATFIFVLFNSIQALGALGLVKATENQVQLGSAITKIFLHQHIQMGLLIMEIAFGTGLIIIKVKTENEAFVGMESLLLMINIGMRMILILVVELFMKELLKQKVVRRELGVKKLSQKKQAPLKEFKEAEYV